jgi:hypothetical protein
MEPKEKANELVKKYKGFGMYNEHIASKQCALIAVDEILLHEKQNHSVLDKSTDYWQEVKKEIENL